MAGMANSLNLLVQHTINWEEGKGPKFPVIGPSSWREEAKPKKRVSIFDVLNKIAGK